MGKIGTKDVTVGSGKLPKNFIPGNHTAKIINMKFQETTFDDRRTGGKVTKAWVVMELETEPVGGDFEGWLIDKDDESKGRRLGQTGWVKSDAFGYEDKTYNGREYSIHKSTIQFLKGLEMEALGHTKFMDSIDGKYDTYDEICKAFLAESGIEGVFLNWCIGGKKEWDEKGEYPVYWMNLPKWSKGSKLYAHPDKSDNLMQFHAQIHVYDKTGGAPANAPAGASASPAPAQTFSPGAEEAPPWNNDDDGEDPFAPSNSTDEDPFATETDSPQEKEEDPFAT